MAWLSDGVEEENQMIGQQAKKKHTLEKFEGESLVWTKPALEPDHWGQLALVKGTHL